MKIEFEFPDSLEDFVPATGVAALAALDDGGVRYFTGHYGEPTTADVVGQATFLLEDAKQQKLGAGDYEDE